ncbi:MAG: DUF1501 domain-containing protein, partial [Planctomycetes bacterium]|nr:DUF1501 domain-containing protein [Planctomycetota bacterium]
MTFLSTSRQPDRQRRRFLQSSLLAGGVGLSLGDVLAMRAAGAESGNRAESKDTAVIQIWLGGGPSQFETFDPKPDAPLEFRGPYNAISTKLPGIQFCETMPKTAMVMKRAAVIRTLSHTTNGHFVGAHWCMSGYAGTTGRITHPCSGSI